MRDWMALDRVLTIDTDTATAIRNVPMTLAVFDTHFPTKPVVPGVLITGSVARLAGLLLAHRTGVDGWQLAGVSRVRFRTFVQPGVQLHLEVTVTADDADEGTATCKATASVDGRPVTTFGKVHLRRGGPT